MFLLKTATRSRSVQLTIARNMHRVKDKAFIDGKWVSAESQAVFEVLNPANEQIIAKIPDMDEKDTEKALQAAYCAFQSWKNTTGKERAALLIKWHELMVKNARDIAEVMTAESGKPTPEAVGEVNYGNSFIDFFAGEATRIHGDILSSANPSKKILVEKHPIGVAGLITPWNFPHAMIARKAGAALAAGCTCVVKPAEDTPLTALFMAELAQEAGIPDGVINIVTSGRKNAPAIGNYMCTSPLVAGISFTGSTNVGKILYKQCASTVKRLGLELGGNAPLIVFPSANIDVAVNGAYASKFRNCGQTCVSSNRLFVHKCVMDEFVENFSTKVKAMKIGEGCKPDVNAGPLINKAQFDKISKMVEDAISKGAKVVIGGKPCPDLGRLFYQPTILTNINKDMAVYNEEVFGPVATIIEFESEEEVIKEANNTRQGLAGYIFSEDVQQIFRVTKALETGMIGVNEGMISAAEAPFGGVKESGLGREGSHYGLEDFTYIKYICIGNLK